MKNKIIILKMHQNCFNLVHLKNQIENLFKDLVEGIQAEIKMKKEFIRL